MSSQTSNVSKPESYDRNIQLKAFDESKTGVKGLVDGGSVKIPSIFVRSAEELSKELGTCDENLGVPIVDLAHVGDGINSHREDVVRRIISASEQWGFFQVVNHGFPSLDKVIESVRLFHEQDENVKKELYSREMTRQVRFDSNFDLYRSKTANWRDTFTVNTFFSGHLDPQQLPPICREAIWEYVNHIVKLCDLLLVLMAEGLGLIPDQLGGTECTKAWNLVGHYYPSCPDPELTLGAGTHSDPSFLTILLQDQIGGLQVLHENKWVNVEPVPDALIVNIGDILQMITNDKFKSVYHRVVANKVGPRISIATFFTGIFSSTKVYGPIQELISEEDPHVYKEFTLQEFYTEFFSRPIDQPGIQCFRRPNNIAGNHV